MRILITGMGGEIGTRVARLLERRRDVESLCGIDFEPPRRRLERAEFHWLRPTDRDGITELVEAFEPDSVVHLGVYEPHGRSTPDQARSRTSEGTATLLECLDAVGSVDRIVLRSGIEVYGRATAAPSGPDEGAPIEPTSEFGRLLAEAEADISAWGDSAGVSVAHLRFAPVSGAHMPSPLARYLRMQVVPVGWPTDRGFTLVHVDDVGPAVAAALERDVDEPVNVVGHGTLTPIEAVRLGGRIPLPIIGPALQLAGVVTEFLGNPLPDHTRELLAHGRVADGSRAATVLGVTTTRSTADVVGDIYEWGADDYLRSGLPLRQEIPS